MTSAQIIRLEEGDHPSAAVPCALVVGNFDGVHRGHQAVFGEAVARAHGRRALAVCALTFDPHPSEIVGTGGQALLTSLEDRVELMGRVGVERVYVRRFARAFASWSPERFVDELVIGDLKAEIVVVGENFRFGAKRAGDLALLRSLGRSRGLEVLVPQVASDERGPYSSTRVRDALVVGDLDEARRVLGRPHAVTGTVVRGDARGRTIGFPTANLSGIAELLPPNGVYAVAVDRADPTGRFSAIAGGVSNLGTRPTVDGTRKTFEVHLLDFAGDLYDARLRVHFLAKLRDEKKFASLDELKAQIAADVLQGRSVLAGERGAPA